MISVREGDVLEQLAQDADETYTACFCDPPYGLGEHPDMEKMLTAWLNGDEAQHQKGFMNQTWDVVPGPRYWREIYRVLKPGAVLLAFAGTRTADLLGIAIRLAGFERFDTVAWVHAQGMPKSHAIGKAIDREAGAEREVIGRVRGLGSNSGSGRYNWNNPDDEADRRWYDASTPATDLARIWEGYGTGLKPSIEFVLCFRKPRRGTYAQTAVEHGTGALNIEGCRIGLEEHLVHGKQAGKFQPGGGDTIKDYHNVTGRWPANLILDEEAAALLDEMSGISKGKAPGYNWESSNNDNRVYLTRNFKSGVHYGDTGGASRFFYVAKSSPAEREAGLEGILERDKYGAAGQWNSHDCFSGKSGDDAWRANHPNLPKANFHPCCKPLALCEYLARLIVPPVEYRDAATLLVPFCGSGSEILGAWQAGWRNIVGIEKEPDYVRIAEARIAHWCKQPALL